MKRLPIGVAACGLVLCASLVHPASPETAAPAGTAAGPNRIAAGQIAGQVLAANRDVGLARRAIAGAEADVISAVARPNPLLALGTSAIDPGRTGGGALRDRSFDTVVQISQLIERGGKRALRGRAAEGLLQAQREALAEVLRQQVLAARLSFFDLLQAQNRVRVADETLGLFARTVAAAALRLQAGDISPTDLARLEVDRLRAENDRRSAMADRDRARHALAFLLGLESQAAQLEVEDDWPDVVQPPPAAELSPFIERRPDVRAAVQVLGVAEAQRDLARALRVRDVTVAAQWERYPTQVQDRTLGFSVSAPLFLNYDYAGEVQRGEVDRQAAADRVDRARAAATAEIRRAAADLADAFDRTRRFDAQLLARTMQAADAAELAYRHGALGVIDLLDARRVLYATRIEAVAARADLARASARWRAATAEPEDTRR